MFSSALKSLSSNINSNYIISSTPTSIAGPWKIYDAKKKSSGKLASVLIFDRRLIDTYPGGLGRSGSSNSKRTNDEILERLKKEASSLARLRHPNILELVEPVEETRNKGLQFVTEHVTASLSELLQTKEDEEKESGTSINAGHCIVDASEKGVEGSKFQLDELEIQKGLEQISKALEFLHDNAGLVHGNLTLDSILINSKSDWKISGLGFSKSLHGSTKLSSIACKNLANALNIDPRLPRSLQFNLDYCSPEIVLDNNLNFAADMFSLGLLIIALYNFPHTSPLKANASVSTYKRIFSSPSSVPSSSNGFLCSRPIPDYLTTSVLPRLISRQPDHRMTAKEFLKSSYFDNVLIATIRFIEAMPAKTPKEKAQFMRGLSAVIPSISKSILEKKILTALIEEMKDMEILSLVLENIFAIINQSSTGQKFFAVSIMPRLKEIFARISNSSVSHDRDPAKEACLFVILENIQLISENCSAREFKDYILPILNFAIESPTYNVVDATLRRLPFFLPALDLSTVKHELFPVIASVFSKTNSLGIKILGLEGFLILCGGPNSQENINGDPGRHIETQKVSTQNPSILDKFTIQEKIIPLIRAIKTKEPAVAMAALNVLRQIGSLADPEFVALEIFPILWNMSLSPLLDLNQFQLFVELIKKLSCRIETEHSRKLQALSGSRGVESGRVGFPTSIEKNKASLSSNSTEWSTIDFENLVNGSVNTTSSVKLLKSGSECSQKPKPHIPETSMGNTIVWPALTPESRISGTPGFGPKSSAAAMEVSDHGFPGPGKTLQAKTAQQTGNFSHSIQPQPLASAIQQPFSDLSLKAHLTAQSSIDWTAASSSRSVIGKPSGSSRVPFVCPSDLSIQKFATETPTGGNPCDLQVPAREVPPEVKHDVSLAPQQQNLNIYSLPSPPQFHIQNSVPPTLQLRGTGSLPQSLPGQSLQPQLSTGKNGLEKWESLL